MQVLHVHLQYQVLLRYKLFVEQLQTFSNTQLYLCETQRIYSEFNHIQYSKAYKLILIFKTPWIIISMHVRTCIHASNTYMYVCTYMQMLYSCGYTPPLEWSPHLINIIMDFKIMSINIALGYQAVIAFE